MGAFAVGDVVVVPFPFTNHEQAKRRPALVVASIPGKDNLLCAITSQKPLGVPCVELTECDFGQEPLRVDPSYVLLGKIMTIEDRIITRKVTELKPDVTTNILGKIRDLFRG